LVVRGLGGLGCCLGFGELYVQNGVLKVRGGVECVIRGGEGRTLGG
jgi:hypothetical protein